ncbi:MAG: acyloxyacyl hydrolase [Smithella sp.]
MKHYLIFLVFAFLFLSKSAIAMPYALFYLGAEDEAYAHSATDSTYGNPDHSRDNSGKQIPGKLSLLNVSIRARFSSFDVLGNVSPEEFREYDLAANFRLPWAWHTQSGWGAGTRLMTSIGALHGAGETALVASFIPLIALGSQDGRFTLDMGAGGALLSRHRFGTQNYGGHFQFALTAGVGIPLFSRIGIGYRYMHYSDSGIYGPHNTGADFHMLELIYRF